MIAIEYGDRPVSHPNLGYVHAGDQIWHLIAFDNWNSTSFCGQRTTGTVEQYASGHVCEVCSQLMDIAHSEFSAA